ncbi:thymidylate synthase [Flavobacteriaceae bacterium]|nr:thymidylate synthase [bacterium]MDB4277659.1 thymidylate synthase [Gammaproteobacteria bacterium]MDB4352780.1 thymidylate synthase [Porticoccaceae bacterium]MDB9801313.1 thymidylate synthase [Flavobacteriaceae bacterium]|tara:strand:- start:3320 stop:4342 length:1023 start_codon:yes stop_codon:yes gene_type:complete
MNKLDKNYLSLLRDILNDGVEKSDRTGTGTISLFGKQIRHKMSDGFPLLTTKKMAVKTMMTELKWFLKGDTNIKYLVDNGCNIWNGDAYKSYQNAIVEVGLFDTMMDQEEFIGKIKTDDEFAQKWGELGPIYGKQWRDWDGRQERDGSYDMSLDQIANLIFQLKRNPDSRRLMVNAWNVGELDSMVLPPCHYGFQVYTKELGLDERIDIYNGSRVPMNRSSDYFHEHMDDYGIPRRSISLMWNQRSVDTFLGLPFNIASYGTLLCLIAKEVGMVPDELIGNLGDVHLYSNHIEQSREQTLREPYRLPTVYFSNLNLLDGEFDYEIRDYNYHPTIKAQISN